MTVNLKVARAIRGMTQLELGQMVGLSASTVSLIERGFRRSTQVERNQLAAALGLDQDEIQWSFGKRVARNSNKAMSQ